MAVQIINPVDTGFPISPLTVEAEAETEDQFEWVSLLCCSYSTLKTTIDADWDEDIDV
jgi:hypothetical protein